MGCKSSEHLRSWLATEPLVSSLEDLDVGPDLRDGRVPARHLEGDETGRSGREVHPGKPGSGAFEPCVIGDCVFSG